MAIKQRSCKKLCHPLRTKQYVITLSRRPLGKSGLVPLTYNWVSARDRILETTALLPWLDKNTLNKRTELLFYIII
jgi:hypothetical protein